MNSGFRGDSVAGTPTLVESSLSNGSNSDDLMITRVRPKNTSDDSATLIRAPALVA
jgi:hypothetical protein